MSGCFFVTPNHQDKVWLVEENTDYLLNRNAHNQTVCQVTFELEDTNQGHTNGMVLADNEEQKDTQRLG